ncbi:MAG: radical SAM protein [Pseudomonadota bacterium]
MRRILFVNATDPLSETENRYRPLWPAYLAAYAENVIGRGQLDFRFATEEISKELHGYRPDLVAIGSVTQNFGYALDYARICRNHGLPVVVGGPHVSLLPETISENMDVGCIGEGEQTFTSLLELFLNEGGLKRQELAGIDGLVFRDNGEIVKTRPRDLIRKLDEIPHPKRDVVGYDRDSYIVSSRGCPYKCAYCASAQFWKTYRFASAEYIVDEIVELIGHGSSIIRFNDDLFAVNRLRLGKMIKLLSHRGFLGKVRFSVSCRANLVTEELVSLLKQLNVVSVTMGLESGSDRVLKTLKNGASVEHNRKALRLFKDAGIQANAFFIIGAPDETESEIHETYNFVGNNPVGFFDVFLLQPLPGTALWDYALEHGLVSNTTMDWSRLRIDARSNMTDAVVLSKELSRERLQSLYRKFMRLRLYNILKTLPRTPWLRFLPRIAWLAVSNELVRILKKASRLLGTSRT